MFQFLYIFFFLGFDVGIPNSALRVRRLASTCGGVVETETHKERAEIDWSTNLKIKEKKQQNRVPSAKKRNKGPRTEDKRPEDSRTGTALRDQFCEYCYSSVFHSAFKYSMALAARRKRVGAASATDEELLQKVQSGAEGAYEALQLYRSRCNRLKAKNDTNGAIQSAATGAITLFDAGYENAGAELADLFVELLHETRQAVNEQIKSLILAIDSKFAVKKTPHRADFLKTCIKWSAELGTRELGDPELHTLLATCLWESGDKNAAYHFTCGEAPELLNKKIFETFPGKDQQTSRERSLTLGVVNFLAMENLRDANDLFRKFQSSSTERDLPVNTDLINFCDYLLQVSRRDAQPLFKQLVNSYASTVDFDESIPTLLMGPIASKLFGIKPKVNPMMSMLQTMMS